MLGVHQSSGSSSSASSSLLVQQEAPSASSASGNRSEEVNGTDAPPQQSTCGKVAAVDLWDDSVEKAKGPGSSGRANGTGSVGQEASSSHDADEATSEITTPERSAVRLASAFPAHMPPTSGPHHLPPHLRDETKTPFSSGVRFLPPHLRDETKTAPTSGVRFLPPHLRDETKTAPTSGVRFLPPHLRDETKTPSTSGARLLPPHLRDETKTAPTSGVRFLPPHLRDETKTPSTSGARLLPPHLRDETKTPSTSGARLLPPHLRDEAETPPASGAQLLPPHLRDETKTPSTSGARLLPPHLRDDGFETRVSSSVKSRAAADGQPSPATTPSGSDNRSELDDLHDDSLLDGKSPLVPDSEESRPIIRIRQVPLELSIQTLLSSIRLPNGRIMLVDFVDEHRYVRLAFAEIAAHNLFLECAFQGAWHPPWSNNPVLEITHGEVLPTSRAERTPGVTRVLQIHGLSPDQMKIDVLLRDITSTAPRWPYSIEKVMLACAGRGDVARKKPFIQVNFASIRDALHARATLRNNRADSKIPYRDANFVFGHDDCCTTGAPLALRSILDMRGGEYAEAGEERSLHGYVQLPPSASISASAIAQWQNAKAKEVMTRVKVVPAPPVPPAPPAHLNPQSDMTGPLVSRATPAATLAKDAQPNMEFLRRQSPMPVPPFDTVLHGIFVHQIPASTTEAQLLRVISGGMVRRMYIFRPGRNAGGTATHAAIFFGTQEVADRVAARILAKGGLMLSSTGRRYRTTPYQPPADFQSRAEDIPVHVTRVVSLTIEDSPPNVSITKDVVRSYIHDISRIFVPATEIMVQKTMPLNAGPDIPSKLRTFTVKFTSVCAARRSIVALQRLNVTGKIRRIKYEHDPCDRPVEMIH